MLGMVGPEVLLCPHSLQSVSAPSQSIHAIVIRHHDRKELVSALRSQSTTEGSQGRCPEVGTEAEAVERHCLMAFSPWLAQDAFLHHPGAPALAGTAPSRLGSSSSLLIKKIQYRPVQANLREAFSQCRVPIPK